MSSQPKQAGFTTLVIALVVAVGAGVVILIVEYKSGWFQNRDEPNPLAKAESSTDKSPSNDPKAPEPSKSPLPSKVESSLTSPSPRVVVHCEEPIRLKRGSPSLVGFRIERIAFDGEVVLSLSPGVPYGVIWENPRKSETHPSPWANDFGVGLKVPADQNRYFHRLFAIGEAGEYLIRIEAAGTGVGDRARFSTQFKVIVEN